MFSLNDLKAVAEEAKQRSIQPVSGEYKIKVPVEVIDNTMAEVGEYAMRVFAWNVYSDFAGPTNSQIEEAYAMNLAFDEEKALTAIVGSPKEEQPTRRL